MELLGTHTIRQEPVVISEYITAPKKLDDKAKYCHSCDRKFLNSDSFQYHQTYKMSEFL